MREKSFALVIDKSSSMRQYITSILGQDGRLGEAVEAESTDHALRILQYHEGRLLYIICEWTPESTALADFFRSIKLRPRLAGARLFLLTADNKIDALNFADMMGDAAVLTKPFAPEELLKLVVAAVGVGERRVAKRIQPLIACDVDLGFREDQETYSGEVINISETGILLRSTVPVQGTGYIYDFATIQVRPVTGQPMKLYGQIVRLEADWQRQPSAENERHVLIAFHFGHLDSATKDQLHQYIILTDPTATGNRN